MAARLTAGLMKSVPVVLLGMLAVLVAVTGTAWSAPGPHLRERVAGLIVPDRNFEAGAVALDLQCFAQLPGDSFCGGTYHCHRASLAPSRPAPACPTETTKINFTFEPLDAASLGNLLRDAGLSEITFDARFTNGVVCHFDGITQQVPMLIDLIPAFQGRYACRDTVGSEVEAGVFSMRTTSFRRLSTYGPR